MEKIEQTDFTPTPSLRDALGTVLTADITHKFLSVSEVKELFELREACPRRSTLEDGIYEIPDEDGDYRIRYVRDDHYAWSRKPDGTLYGGGNRLPDDVSGWRRLDVLPVVTPELIEEAGQEIAVFCGASWESASEAMKDHYRALAHMVLIKAGLKVPNEDE